MKSENALSRACIVKDFFHSVSITIVSSLYRHERDDCALRFIHEKIEDNETDLSR